MTDEQKSSLRSRWTPRVAPILRYKWYLLVLLLLGTAAGAFAHFSPGEKEEVVQTQDDLAEFDKIKIKKSAPPAFSPLLDSKPPEMNLPLIRPAGQTRELAPQDDMSPGVTLPEGEPRGAWFTGEVKPIESNRSVNP